MARCWQDAKTVASIRPTRRSISPLCSRRHNRRTRGVPTISSSSRSKARHGHESIRLLSESLHRRLQVLQTGMWSFCSFHYHLQLQHRPWQSIRGTNLESVPHNNILHFPSTHLTRTGSKIPECSRIVKSSCWLTWPAQLYWHNPLASTRVFSIITVTPYKDG